MTLKDFKNKKSPTYWEGFRMGIASILALLIGAMSIVAGSKVLLGFDIKNYTILNWLVVYNVIYGVISIITAYFIWTKHQFAQKASFFILVSHSILLLNLSLFNEEVAPESIKAMVFRVIIWTIIILLTLNFKTHKK